ncbi:MFS transporter [Mycobacterium sp. 21AC1]|uniref:MFS transporter n=1 Tax=[Mycobacterium] appelbergii TaxID=2939269 RepID=UPI002938E8EC|nr:MFS transporter [Mycobacterium sp. 21AC1]MDV3123996.1 MFS transporter [Mycobacterium sp. 21AC1]
MAGSAAGNALEWFDYGVYGYLTIYIGYHFFSPFSDDPGTQRLFALFGFAISFLLRPIGGIVLGPLGDRIGRKKVLVATIAIISISTTLIGLLPTADELGLLAPILLFTLRSVQGFSAGGEYAGAAVFMSEHAPDNRRGFYGSFLEFGTLAGFSAAAILCTTLTVVVGEDAMQEFWWRIPFLVCLPLGLLAIWMRRSLTESETFSELDQAGRTESPLRALVDLTRNYPGQLVKLTGFVMMLNVAFYLVLTYMPTYLSGSLGQSETASGMMLVAIQIVMMAVIVPFGALTDRVGRRPVLLCAAIGLSVLSVPAVMLMDRGSIFLELVGIAVLGLLLVALLSNISATLPALFPTSVRYSGFALGYNVATAAFGGTAGLVVQWLIQRTGITIMPGIYLAGAGAIGFAAVLFFDETAGRSLRGTQIPGSDDETRIAAGETLIGRVNRKR